MTKKQRLLLNFIESFIATNHYAPTYREIMKNLDYRSVSTVAIHVDNLIKLGYLEKKNRSARSLQLTNMSKDVKHLEWLMQKMRYKISHSTEASEKEQQQNITHLVHSLNFLGYHHEAESIKKKINSLYRV